MDFADLQKPHGALTTPAPAQPAHQVDLLQRSKVPQGKQFGKTSGWMHRALLKTKGVPQLSGVNYDRIHRRRSAHPYFRPNRQRPRLLAVDNVVLWAYQESVRDLENALRTADIDLNITGGAAFAAEPDAKRAIMHSTELAARLGREGPFR